MDKSCPNCFKDTILSIGEIHGKKLYSCSNEDCNNYAEVLIYHGGIFIKIDELLTTLKDITNE